jgi:hypothetical protein
MDSEERGSGHAAASAVALLFIFPRPDPSGQGKNTTKEIGGLLCVLLWLILFWFGVWSCVFRAGLGNFNVDSSSNASVLENQPTARQNTNLHHQQHAPATRLAVLPQPPYLPTTASGRLRASR